MRRFLACIVLCALVAIPAAAQQQALTTTFSGSNGLAGNMFDVVAVNDVTIDSFDVNVDPGTWDVEVYTRDGTHYLSEVEPAAWTLAGTAVGVVSNGTGVSTPLSMNLNVCIPKWSSKAFYVTISNGPGNSGFNCTNGTTLGAVAAQDANIRILEGTTNGYPFSTYYPYRAGFTSKIFNGTVHYTTGVNCPPPPYQMNRPEAHVNIDYAQSNGFDAGVRSVYLGSPATANFQSALSGNPYDVAITSAPVVPSFLVTSDVQIINLDLSDSSLFFMNSGGQGINLSPFPGNFSMNLTAPQSPLNLSAQMVILDSTSPDGFVLSQGAELDVQGCSASADFDDLPRGVNAPLGWTNPSAGATHPWWVNWGHTPSAWTGPSSAYSGPNYMYCETTTGVYNAQFVMDTCLIETSQLTNFTLDFVLSRIATPPDYGTLYIYQDDGSGSFSTLIATYVGLDPNQSTFGNEWSQESIPFSPSGSRVAFRFHYAASISPREDLAIDDVQVN